MANGYIKCNKCKCEILKSYPHFQDNDNNYHLCWECAFKSNKITESEYLKYCGVYLDNMRAVVYEDKIHLLYGKQKEPWNLTNKDRRKSNDYKQWRTSVFERDKYTCQHCRQVGGELNAHHIKNFKKHSRLRFKLSNGITLCKQCHINEHKKKVVQE